MNFQPLVIIRFKRLTVWYELLLLSWKQRALKYTCFLLSVFAFILAQKILNISDFYRFFWEGRQNWRQYQWINAREKPLAAYLFMNDKELMKEYVGSMSAGGLCINDTTLQPILQSIKSFS